MTESETVTVSNVIAIASLDSEIWLAMGRHTHTHTYRRGLGSTAYDFANKKPCTGMNKITQ